MIKKETGTMPKGHGGMPNMGGMNMNNLMKQAQKMQKQIADMQTELETKTLEITAGGGAVKVVISGKKEIQELKIAPGVVDPDDVEMLEDLVVSAVNEAIRQMDEMLNGQMSQLTGGMGLPGGLL
jgi:DNA-binding YbaB/EbfC family protein